MCLRVRLAFDVTGAHIRQKDQSKGWRGSAAELQGRRADTDGIEAQEGTRQAVDDYEGDGLVSRCLVK